jgi:uncharacterized protein (TIGR03067 family)
MSRSASSVVLAAAMILHVGASPRASEDPPSGDELARHQGTWVATSFVWDGHESPPEVVASIRRIVEGRHVVWKRDGKSFAGTTLELDPTKEPHAIDVIPDGGPSMGKRVLGIYKLEGDHLTICMAPPDRERPSEFRAGKGSGLTLMSFTRERPEK